MRSAKPWYRKQKDTWCVYLNGSLVTLSQGKANKKKAEQEFHKLMLHGGRVPEDNLNLGQVCDLFLDHSLSDHAKSTYDQNKYFLQSFCNSFGRVKVRDLKVLHLTQWLKNSSWGPTSRNRAIGAAKHAFNWCLEQGHVKTNPFRLAKKPKSKRRERILTPKERQLIFKKIKGHGFRDFLTCLEETGARPGELARLTSENFDFKRNVAVLWKHKSGKKTGKPRIIFLTPKSKEICERLVRKYRKGPVFRTIDNNPWTKDSLNCRFRRLRQKYPQLKGVTAYSVRHGFATNALERGVPLTAVAELMGHSSTDMIERVYGHLDQKGDYLSEMARKATGG